MFRPKLEKEDKNKLFPRSKLITQKSDLEEIITKLKANDPGLEDVCFSGDGRISAEGKIINNDYKLSSDDIEKLAGALKVNRTLKKLSIFSYGSDVDDMAVTWLADAIKSNQQIKLERLDLTLKVSDKGAKQLAQALQTNTSLTHLSLATNKISDEGGVELAKALESNSTLEVLWLPGNNMGDISAAHFAQSLHTNKTLKGLGLLSNYITDLGAAQLAESLKINGTLEELELGFQFKKDWEKKGISKVLIKEIGTLLEYNKYKKMSRYRQ